MEIRAAVATQPGLPLSTVPLQLADVGDNDVLIEYRAAGLCHSDLHTIEGPEGVLFPLVPGHEGAGVVLEVGRSVTDLKPGDHVVTCGMGECGHCANCRSHKTNLCQHTGFHALTSSYRRADHFRQIDGSDITIVSPGATFASHTICDRAYVTPVPDSIPFETACVISCAVLTGVGSVLFTAKVEPGSTVAVIGLGGVGLNAIDGARLADAGTIIGIDSNPAKAELGLQFGMTHFVNPADGDVVDQIREITGGGSDYAFECVGHPALINQAIEMTRPEWGIVTLIGVPKSAFPLNATDIMSGRTVTGSYFGKAKTRTDLRRLAEWVAEGKLNSSKLVTHVMPLDEINRGFELMLSGKSVRSVVTF